MKYSWVPHPQQVKALTFLVHELLYGGARGGGKTDAGLVWMVEPRYILNPSYTGLVIRRNANDLTDWIDRARKMYKPLNAKITGIQPEIRFPSGAVIRTGHLKDASSYEKYQGHEYQKILIEELTKIPREQDYEQLIASARSTIPGLPARVFATTNPDGPGQSWVRKRWCCDQPDERIRTYTYPDPSNPSLLQSRTRLYIPAKVEDNPTLIQNDPTYVSFLNSIQDPVLRAQWRDGSWEDIPLKGSYYADLILQLYQPLYDPNQSSTPINPRLPFNPISNPFPQLKYPPAPFYQPPKLLQPPRILDFPINHLLPTDTWWDLGVNDSTAIWFTQTVNNTLYVIDFLEASNLKMADYIQLVLNKPYHYNEHFAPHDINVREWGGGSRLEQARKLNFQFRTVPKLSIPDGIEAARNLLSPTSNPLHSTSQQPPQTFFHLSNTEQGIYLLKSYKKEWDKDRLVFSDKPVHDFASNAADAFRYLAVGHERFRSQKPIPQHKPSKPTYKTRRS